MKDSSLVQLLKKLPKSDRRALRKWVRSPFFNQRQDVVELLKYLEEAFNSPMKPLDKRVIFSTLYPGKKFEEQQLRYVMSFLLQAIKKFLAYREWSEEPVREKIYLVKALRKLGADSLFEKEMRSTQKIHEKNTLRNGQYYFQKYQLQLEYYEFLLRRQRRGGIHLHKLPEELSAFFISETLRLACTLHTHRNISAKAHPMHLLQEALTLSGEKPFCNLPAVAVYANAYRALTHSKGEKYFRELKREMLSLPSEFSREEARDIYLLVINFCIKQVNEGNKTYIQEALDLYHQGIESGILLENKQLSKYTYNNVLMLALAKGEFDWAKRFLEEFKPFLRPKERENIYKYNLANLYYRLPDYGKAMKLLQQVEFKDLLYNLQARTILLKIYFELGEFDALESLLESFQTYIRRHKELGYHKEMYKNLLKFVKKLLYEKNNKSVHEALEKEILNTSSVAEKDWLLKQVGKNAKL